jgi:hypothetical protein
MPAIPKAAARANQSFQIAESALSVKRAGEGRTSRAAPAVFGLV